MDDVKMNKADDQTTGRSSIDDIIDVYMRDVDRTLIRENLKLSVEQRIEQLMKMQRFAAEEKRAGRVWRDSEVLTRMKVANFKG